MRIIFAKIILFLLLTSWFLLLSTISFAQDFRNDYQVEYFLSEQENKLNTRVKFTVSITNFSSKVYVKQFSLGFPKLFTIKDIKVFDDKSALNPQVTTENSITKISTEFSNPNVGRNTVNNLYLEFYQGNLFNINGNVWEVIIPTIDDKTEGNYKILVHLPDNSTKKISIAKPKPDSITGNTIIWNNPSTKTVYAVFGDIQYYQTDLIYKVVNSKLIPVYTDIAFPPDTLRQKIYLDKINPRPDEIFSDEDGNFLGRYYLNPREKKTINYSGIIAVSANIRDNLVANSRNKLSLQKEYLLSERPYWKITETDKISGVPANAEGIFDFVTNRLTYDYNKITLDNKRLGAEAVLKKPDQAVCMEFTDLFIALARRNGIYAREIQGYGFSQDAKLRPLSLLSDILHSWPEFYDPESRLWIPIDPTWQNTSGIDYFSSFDLNHIAFVIHGKDPEYPLPAGTYKTENSRDVSISATDKIPEEKQQLTYSYDPFPSRINDSRLYQTKIVVQNEGNVYYWGNPILIKSNNLEINPTVLTLTPLAPFEKKTLLLSYKALKKNRKLNADLSMDFPTGKDLSVKFTIIPFYYELALKISFFILIISLISFLILRKRRNPQGSGNLR